MLKKQLIKSEAIAPHAWHRMLVIDVSGSMWDVISQMMDGIINIISQMPPSDVITVGMYSEDYWWIIDRANVADPSIPRILKANAYTRSTTKFSGILADAINLRDQTPLQLCWFTDGHPVPDTRQEVDNTLQALKALKPESAVLVGYGNYNRKLLSQMADACGGMLVNATSLPHVMSVFQTNLTAVKNVGVPVKIESPSFTLGETGLVSHPAGSTAYLNNTTLYTLTEKGDALQYEDIVALALYHNTRNNTPDALKVLAQANDPYLYKLLSRAHTNAEHARAEKAMWDAITNPAMRYLAGKKDFVPLLEESVITVLESAVGKPIVLGNYQRIGRPSKPQESPLRFVPSSDWVAIAIVYHSELNNISLRVQQRGTVFVSGDRPWGVPDSLPVSRYRTFAIVCNGELNVPSLQIDGQEVSLENRPMFDDVTVQVDRMAELAVREAVLSAQMTVWKRLLPPQIKTDYLSEDASLWLAQYGVRSNIFSPPSTTEPATDYYMADAFSVTVAGFSNVPKFEDIKPGKKLTVAQTVVSNCLEVYQQWQHHPQTVIEALVKNQLDEVGKELAVVRKELNTHRMIILATKQPLFETRSDLHSVVVGDYTVKFKFGKAKVAL
ncbi:MAG: VWA domain-containing protein [Chryseobacterium sp.]|nr:MAG: VWA domain-containing protein [Chryseobacterium sp.]